MVDLYDDADVYDTLDQYDAGSGIATYTDTPLPHVRVLWRPEQFNRCAVHDFEGGALGAWSTTAGINAAGTSITIIGTADYTGTHSAWVQAPATAGAGCHYDFGSDRFYDSALYGTAYVAVVYIRWVSGSNDVALVFGSEGTSDDRQTARFEINSAWQPIKVVWLPHANRTDVQLAIVSQYAQACQFTIDAITVYQLDGFSQVENSCFLTDDTGWSIDASINAVGDSLSALSGFGSSRDGGDTCGRLFTRGENGSGCHYDLGARMFKAGRTYRLRVALKGLVAGDTMSCRLRLGRTSDAADRGDTGTFTLSDQWDWYSVDWTPDVDCLDAELAITNGAAAALEVDIDGVEAYEALDDVSAPYLAAMTWKRGTDGPGTLQATLNDAARRFDPRNTGSPLAGSVKAGRRIWARATYAGKLYPVAYGTLRQIVPRADDLAVDLMAEDPLGDAPGSLGRVTWTIGLQGDESYNELRWWALNQIVADGLVHYGPGVPKTRYLGAHGIEDGNFYSVADNVQVADFLSALDEATGSETVIRPAAEAETMWRYTVTDRATLTDAGSIDEAVDDDFAALDGFTTTDETLENHQQVPWQAYSNIGDFTSLISAADVSVYGGADPDDPYWHFNNDAFGNDDNVPPPTYRKLNRQFVHAYRIGHAGHEKKKVTKVRVYPNPFVPFHLAAGDTKAVSIDFGCTVAGCLVVVDGPTGATNIAVINSVLTADHFEFTLLAMAADTVDFLAVWGTPSKPTEEQTATTIWHASAAADGDRLGPTISTPYVSSKGAAQGLGQYRNWRYSVARMRPTMTVEHRFPSILQRDVNDHLAVTGPRYSLDAEPFLITGIEGSMGDGSRRWSMTWALEEIPAGGPWFTLDSSLLGTGSRPLAH